MSITNECYNYNFGKYPKAKYTLFLNNKPYYYFTTTIRDEEYCMDVMDKLISGMSFNDKKYYRVVKKTSEREKVLACGKCAIHL
jgi:hypothetical protein